MVVVIVEDTEGIGDGVHHRLGNLLPGLVAAQHAAPVGSQVEVDEGLDSQVSCRAKLAVKFKFLSAKNLTVIIGPGLQREERVDVDGPHSQPLLGGVVRVTEGAAPVSLHGVERIASIARLGLGQTEGYFNVWLEF